MADKQFVERAEERKRLANCYVDYRMQGIKKWGFLKPPPTRALLINISKGGLGMRTIEALKPQTVIDATLQIFGMKEPIAIKARIVWCKEERKIGSVNYTHVAGGQFVEFSPEAWRAIQKLVAE
jgi:hypothetical protein